MPAVIPDLERQEEISQDDEERLFKRVETALKAEFKELGITRAEMMVLAYEGKQVPNDLKVAYQDGLTKVASIISRAMAFSDLLGRIRVIRNCKKQGAEVELHHYNQRDRLDFDLAYNPFGHIPQRHPPSTAGFGTLEALVGERTIDVVRRATSNLCHFGNR